MYSILDTHTMDKDALAKQLLGHLHNDSICIEIPKSGQLHFIERQVLHEDYILCAYSHHLLNKFEIVSLEIPDFDAFHSFTFDIKSRNDINFFRELAEVLISISAGYENECFDAEDSANFIDDAYQHHQDWTKGLVQTDPIVLNHYQRLLTEWPLDEEEQTD